MSEGSAWRKRRRRGNTETTKWNRTSGSAASPSGCWRNDSASVAALGAAAAIVVSSVAPLPVRTPPAPHPPTLPRSDILSRFSLSSPFLISPLCGHCVRRRASNKYLFVAYFVKLRKHGKPILKKYVKLQNDLLMSPLPVAPTWVI